MSSIDLQQIEQFFKDRGFCQRIGFGIKPVVVVIDFMLAFTKKENPLGGDLEREIKTTNTILKAARDKKIPIYHTVVWYEEAGLRDAGIWALKQRGLETLVKGSEDVRLDPRLDYNPGDGIVLKKYASAFFGTDLASRLNSQRVDTVIVCGCTTSGCVRATVVDAIQYGFKPVVVKQAVGDRSPISHQVSLFDMDAKYADVVDTEEVLKYFSELG